jgi:hypothetical protein
MSMQIEKLLWKFHYELNASQKVFFNDKERMRYSKTWLKKMNKKLDKDYKEYKDNLDFWVW